MWGYILVISVFLGLVFAQSGDDSLLVDTRQGPVRGYKQPNSDVFAFYGIPYATAPTGRQKFMPPLPPPQWTEPLEAVQDNIVCIQPSFESQEDCLIANIYVPDTDQTNLPVMVNVHGGAFQYLYGTFQKPISIVNNTNMIAVSFNYRLGVHGFLCLGTEEVPGNAGMKDQVALLRWVQENIASFGGNPNDVTIEGCSAGGVSVGLLSLSPMSEGLFHRVIAASGGNGGSFGIQIDPLENARSYAKILNFNNVDNLEALEEFYKTASYETLVSRHDLINGRIDSNVWFTACVEADLGTERFLDDAPVNIMRRQNLTRYPMLYGYTNMEGLIRIDLFDTWKDMMNTRFSDFLPADLEFDSEEEREQVATMVKQFYFGNEAVSENNILAYVDFFTDALFAYSMLRSVRLHSEFGNNPIYLYEYSFADVNTPLVPHTSERGANHCDQNRVVKDAMSTNFTEEFIAMQEIMRKFYTNFLLTGMPVPEGSSLPAWPPTNAQRNPHMSIGSSLQLLGPLSQKRAEFWDNIYDQYYRMPIPPKASSGLRQMLSSYLVIVLAMLNLIK